MQNATINQESVGMITGWLHEQFLEDVVETDEEIKEETEAIEQFEREIIL